MFGCVTFRLQIVEFAELDKTGLHFHRSLLQSLLCDYPEDTCRWAAAPRCSMQYWSNTTCSMRMRAFVCMGSVTHTVWMRMRCGFITFSCFCVCVCVIAISDCTTNKLFHVCPGMQCCVCKDRCSAPPEGTEGGPAPLPPPLPHGGHKACTRHPPPPAAAAPLWLTPLQEHSTNQLENKTGRECFED